MYMGLVERNLFGENPTNDSDNDSAQLVGSATALAVLMGLVMITRIYCRAYLLRSMGADDWTMIVASVWVGLVFWGDSSEEGEIFVERVCIAALGLATSDLVQRNMEQGNINGLCLKNGLPMLVSLAAVLTSVFWCVPPEYTWKMFTPEGKDMKGVCLDQHVLQYTLPAINILTDFIVWLLPLKMIWGIQLPPRQKAGLPSVEATISIICGSAPAIKPFFSKFIPGLLGVTSIKSYTHPTSETYGRSGASKPIKPKSHPAAYPLSSLNPVAHHEESSSTEELGFGTSTKIEGRIASTSISGSEECLNENGSRGGHGGIGEGVKVTTDVQVHVEERV
ncbi:unnamed protein product [Tuber aestivum]|uniref:Rhodopsin domain-containing protein n=1 Tax=Tuber aestivum TaxID=59557 RepID=A0A292PQJ9_9PEZI|nr:unnamed protein product [Tuber aestivum]